MKSNDLKRLKKLGIELQKATDIARRLEVKSTAAQRKFTILPTNANKKHAERAQRRFLSAVKTVERIKGRM